MTPTKLSFNLVVNLIIYVQVKTDVSHGFIHISSKFHKKNIVPLFDITFQDFEVNS